MSGKELQYHNWIQKSCSAVSVAPLSLSLNAMETDVG